MVNQTPKTIAHQLPLAIQLNDEATLADFYWGDNLVLHQQLLDALHGQGEKLFYLWGEPGRGKSHLLQACCQEMSGRGSASYLPLSLLKEWGPMVLDGLDEQRLICIDDIDAIVGAAIWEEALFHLYNRVRDQEDGVLIMSGQTAPAQTLFTLPDLKSRLSWGIVAHLQELDDDYKVQTLMSHAQKRGFLLPQSVAHFLISRCGRNMHALDQMLNQLDEASLIAQRKITIPFVKAVFGI